jgi:hypothetical protein
MAEKLAAMEHREKPLVRCTVYKWGLFGIKVMEWIERAKIPHYLILNSERL